MKVLLLGVRELAPAIVHLCTYKDNKSGVKPPHSKLRYKEFSKFFASCPNSLSRFWERASR
jgi:hypothetical protein